MAAEQEDITQLAIDFVKTEAMSQGRALTDEETAMVGFLLREGDLIEKLLHPRQQVRDESNRALQDLWRNNPEAAFATRSIRRWVSGAPDPEGSIPSQVY